jgi:hypothetical protein
VYIKVCTQLLTKFIIFRSGLSDIRINCNRISEGLLYFFYSWGGARRHHCWAYFTGPRWWWWWVWSSWWNEFYQGRPKYSEKTCPSATLSTTNPTCPNLWSNPAHCGGKPATNRPMALKMFFETGAPSENSSFFLPASLGHVLCACHINLHHHQTCSLSTTARHAHCRLL